jgi:hypothetical protein
MYVHLNVPYMKACWWVRSGYVLVRVCVLNNFIDVQYVPL